MKRLVSERKTESFPAVVVLFLLLTWIVPIEINAQSNRDVIEGYVGWEGNPDSLTVYIDDSFTASEKDSIREAMKRWNKAGAKPGFKETKTKPASITVKEGDPGKSEDGTDNAGIAAISGDSASGKVTGVEIIIRNKPIPGLRETATHELGHAIGLDDTEAATNPKDVMKGTGNTNGTDGNLSDHDKTELKAAIKSITVEAPPPVNTDPVKKRAMAPASAVEPGQNAMIQFDLQVPFPPGTLVEVESAGDSLLQVLDYSLNFNILEVFVALLPDHGAGKFYLDILVEPPLPDPPYHFLGYHFVNPNPVPPITFQCPCEIYEENGEVHLIWKELHNYPLPTDLRASLTVDGHTMYKARGGQNFAIELPPGEHTFELNVDDFQINDCTFQTTYTVTGSPKIPLGNWAVITGILLIGLFTIVRFRPKAYIS